MLIDIKLEVKYYWIKVGSSWLKLKAWLEGCMSVWRFEKKICYFYTYVNLELIHVFLLSRLVLAASCHWSFLCGSPYRYFGLHYKNKNKISLSLSPSPSPSPSLLNLYVRSSRVASVVIEILRTQRIDTNDHGGRRKQKNSSDSIIGITVDADTTSGGVCRRRTRTRAHLQEYFSGGGET